MDRDVEATAALAPCTCHPDDRPEPCQHKYALHECKVAALNAKLDTPLPQLPDYPFPEEFRESYTFIRWVPNQGWCGVHRLMFHWTMHYGIDPTGCNAGRYCFETEYQALYSMAEWNGEGDPPGEWHKHPRSGRRRDPKTGEIWNENDREAEAARAMKKRQHSAGAKTGD